MVDEATTLRKPDVVAAAVPRYRLLASRSKVTVSEKQVRGNLILAVSSSPTTYTSVTVTIIYDLRWWGAFLEPQIICIA
jgi:hypothetical protein